jgi:hypothetical protein
MNLPLYANDLVTDAQGLVVALLLGLAFGFFLERAGFGSSRKLTAQFYLYDMAVIKVMFTAIVTAAVGLWLLSAAGWLDIGALYLTPTSPFAQLAGGLVLGAGFLIGGYCPGTSVVATASGSGDGLVYALGFGAGLVVYAEILPGVEVWANAGKVGEITLPQAWGVPYGAVVLGLVAAAAAVFALAGWFERRYRHLAPD